MAAVAGPASAATPGTRLHAALHGNSTCLADDGNALSSGTVEAKPPGVPLVAHPAAHV
jgi:hypothetical protein